MGTVSRGFRGRRRPTAELPPGQYLVEDFPVLSAIATVPIFLWELSLGIWLVVKGFKPSPIATGMAEPSVAA